MTQDKFYVNVAPADHNEPTVGQYPNGSWYWLDETWNYGDSVEYPTREAASAAQLRYCREVLLG